MERQIETTSAVINTLRPVIREWQGRKSKCSHVFIWNELEDQTFQEIADRTGENIKTLISRKRYAVQHLRKRLQTLYEEFLDY